MIILYSIKKKKKKKLTEYGFKSQHKTKNFPE